MHIKPSAVVSLVCVVLAAFVLGSFAFWTVDTESSQLSTPINTFRWAITLAVVWLLLLKTFYPPRGPRG